MYAQSPKYMWTNSFSWSRAREVQDAVQSDFENSFINFHNHRCYIWRIIYYCIAPSMLIHKTLWIKHFLSYMYARPVSSVVVHVVQGVVHYLYGSQEYHLIDRAVMRSEETKQYNSSFSWENYRILCTWTLISFISIIPVTRISLQPKVHWSFNNK